jgi:hypothetical protein
MRLFPRKPQTEAERLADELTSIDTLKYDAAFTALFRMGDEAAGPLVAVLRKEARVRTFERFVRVFLAGTLMLVLPVKLVLGKKLGINDFVLASYVLIVLMRLVLSRTTRLQKDVSELLSRLGDPRHIGTLLQAYQIVGRPGLFRGSQELENALLRQLERVRASDPIRLTDEQARAMAHALREGSPDVRLALLKAIELIGDKRVLPDVERVARGRSDPVLAGLASECVQFLHRLAEEERVRQTLLRPSEEAPAEPLLRAARNAEDGLGELLRPA